MVRKNYSFANSADEIRKMLETNSAYRENWENAKKAVPHVLEHFQDDPSLPSGWGHDCVCPACTTRLSFPMKDSCTPPGEYLCPHCQKMVSGASVDAAWIAFYRSELAHYAHVSAIGTFLGDETCMAYLYRFLDYYAAHYAEYEPHGRWVGKGKVMAQSLDESIWILGLVKHLYPCKSLIPAEKLNNWYENLFLPAAEFLFPQANRIHNISLWIQSAVGAVAICFDNQELLSRVMDSKYGIREQIRRGFTKDGLWRECSIHYHYYSLQGLTDFLALYASVCPQDPIFDCIGRYYTIPFSFSHDGVHFQAINDGWYPLRVSAYIYEMASACRFLDDPLMEEQLTLFEKRENPLYLGLLFHYQIPHLQTKMLPKQELELFPYSNFAILRNPFYAILKSGSLTDIHSHCDYLSAILPPFSDDIGTPSYAHPMLSTWYHMAPSHNTVTVDGVQPDSYKTFSVLKTHVEACQNGAKAVLEKGEWSDITNAYRSLTVCGDCLRDETVFESESEHCFDWFFHSIGEEKYSTAGTPVAMLSDQNGYQFLEGIKKRACEDTFEASFTLQGGKKLTVSVRVSEGMQVYTARSPHNPSYEKRNTVILRQTGKKAVFSVCYRISE